MSDVSMGEGWWQASDGQWYSPQRAKSAPPATPAGLSANGQGPAAGTVNLMSMLGWALTVWGVIATISLMVRFNELTEFSEVGLPDFVATTWQGVVLIGLGLTVASLGHLLSAISSRL